MTVTHDNTLTNKQKYMGNIKGECKVLDFKKDVTKQVEELKRLQLEIDDINEWRRNSILESKYDYEILWAEKYQQIESNTSRIAEIILNEL